MQATVSARADVLLSSWLTNNSGQYARVFETTQNQVQQGPVGVLVNGVTIATLGDGSGYNTGGRVTRRGRRWQAQPR